MELLQPLMLWGAGAVVVPVIIHFWHQKKGKTLAWAATRWLREKDQQQQRGIRLDNLLLLLLRGLMVVLLAFLLSQPVLNGLTKSPAVQKIHLVQPDPLLADNFRFELESALKKGEKIYWITASTEPVKNLSERPDEGVFTTTALQSAINELSRNFTELNLYLVNDERLARAPFIRVPTAYRLHLLADSGSRLKSNYLELTAGKNVYVNRLNQLTTRPDLDKTVRFQAAPAHQGPIHVLLDYRQADEQQTVWAALNALSEVYGLDLQIQKKRTANDQYDWILTDREVAKPAARTLYVVSGKQKLPTVSNVVYTGEPLTPQTAELVKAGRLPEWLGELFMRHFRLNPNPYPLSRKEVDRLFVATAKPAADQPEKIRNGLFLVFVLLVGGERWIALRKNA
ncbi:BatA domain-containing protein [Larkinella insperata]|uniref:BatA domain-containing protein n=1 Tax=Larkinella insperata TaxID=332158 RepID=A0ABW3QLJ7_9BACT|nr:BatA domain-containing protein [Larkinella insperata]